VDEAGGRGESNGGAGLGQSEWRDGRGNYTTASINMFVFFLFCRKQHKERENVSREESKGR